MGGNLTFLDVAFDDEVKAQCMATLRYRLTKLCGKKKVVVTYNNLEE